jgi:hypothetical protein
MRSSFAPLWVSHPQPPTVEVDYVGFSPKERGADRGNQFLATVIACGVSQNRSIVSDLLESNNYTLKRENDLWPMLFF